MVVVERHSAGEASTPAPGVGESVIMRGDGETTFTCGSCEAPILVGVERGLVERFLFRCRSCGVALRIGE
jgi:hypothetical protein